MLIGLVDGLVDGALLVGKWKRPLQERKAEDTGERCGFVCRLQNGRSMDVYHRHWCDPLPSCSHEFERCGMLGRDCCHATIFLSFYPFIQSRVGSVALVQGAVVIA
jgi:hypothetical protein